MSPILSLRHYNHDQIIHSHHHTQLVFGLRGRLDFEIEGQGSRIQQQFLAVVPSEARHACGSPDGSMCLVLDIPDGDWLQQRLGHHSDSARRLLEQSAALHLNPMQSQLVGWLAASPVNDPDHQRARRNPALGQPRQRLRAGRLATPTAAGLASRPHRPTSGPSARGQGPGTTGRPFRGAFPRALRQ